MKKTVSKALTIGGSDSGGCAGIQADLKTFLALKVHGMSVITAITAQNTRGLTATQSVMTRIISAQLEAVLVDIGAGAVKTGMIPGPKAVRVITDCLREFRVRRYVLDPVMFTTSGERLISDRSIRSLRCSLLPHALIITPNRGEAEVLAQRPVNSLHQVRDAASVIHDLGVAYVLVKGGHFPGPAVDILYDGRDFLEFSSPKVQTRNLHGTGCTLSAAITAYLAKGHELVDSVGKAKAYLDQALRSSFSVGKGPGPLGHLSW